MSFLETLVLEHDRLCVLALSYVLCCVTLGKYLTTQFSPLVVMPPPSHSYEDVYKMLRNSFSAQY